MKKAIRFVCVLSIMSILFSIVMIAGATSPDEEARKYLRSIGTDDAFLEFLDDQQVQELYTQYKDQDVKFSGYSTTVKEIAEPGITKGTIPTSKLQLTVSTYDILSGNQILRVETHVYYFWSETPSIRNTDGIAVNWDPSVFQLDGTSFYGYQNYTFNGVVLQTPKLNSIATAVQGGFGWNFDMKYNNLAFNFRGEFHFNLLPRYVMYKGGGSNSQINAEYGHETNPFGVNAVIGFSVAGLQVSLSGVFKDTLATPYNWYA